jgi:signal transduction histidine kinase
VESVTRRADELFGQYRRSIHERTDRLFAGLMAFQWLMGIVFALWVSPLAWEGPVSRTHLHVWAAVLLGGLISLFPALLGLLRPGVPSTRYVIAIAQMLMGALLIHLTGGRIETHFHVFGSLAFLAFYRDWRVLIPATIVVALDHMLRGIFWPQSVYGVLVASQWRWLEHAAWVLFEDVFLFVACRRSIAEMQQTADRTAALEHEVRTRQQAELDARTARARNDA